MLELKQQLDIYPIWLKHIFDEHIKDVRKLPTTRNKFSIEVRVLDYIFNQNANFEYIIDKSQNILMFNESSKKNIYSMYRRTFYTAGHSYGNWWFPIVHQFNPIHFSSAWNKGDTIFSIKVPIIGWYKIGDLLVLSSYPNYKKIANGAKNNYPLMFKKLQDFLNCFDHNKINNIIDICIEVNQ